jgi:hypothetical protein
MSFGGTFFILPGERGVVDGTIYAIYYLRDFAQAFYQYGILYTRSCKI